MSFPVYSCVPNTMWHFDEEDENSENEPKCYQCDKKCSQIFVRIFGPDEMDRMYCSYKCWNDSDEDSKIILASTTVE